MDFQKLLSFHDILKKSFKIMARNGKLMSSIAILYLVLYSLTFFFFIHSTKSLIYNLLEKEINLSFANLCGNTLAKLLKVDFVFPIALFFLSLFVQTATILVSAMSFKEKNFSFKDLVLRLYGSWTRPFITSFHVTLYFIGFTFFAFAMVMIPPMMIYDHAFSYTLFYLLSFLAIVFYLNFLVIWVLALVISVIEESSTGVEALGKAGKLVKGKKLHGFILNFLFSLLPLALICGAKGIIVERSLVAVEMIIWVLLICANCVMNMFQFTVYTVLYFECKKNHGEEIELEGEGEGEGEVGYRKVPSLPVANESEPATIYKNLFKYYAFQIF